MCVIGAFTSIKAEGIAREDYTFHVLEGASYLDEFGYNEELTKLVFEHDLIEFYPLRSRPVRGSRGQTPRRGAPGRRWPWRRLRRC